MMNKYLFIDAETDGLHGPFISVAIIVTDDKFDEIERYYIGVDMNQYKVKDQWVIDNVVPYMGQYEVCADEAELLERTWSIWMKYREDAYAIGDVIFPVESRLFSRCIGADESRKFIGPFPLLDVASILYAKGYDPLIDRCNLVTNPNEGKQHNALYDVEMMVLIMRKIKGDKNE